MSNQTEVKPGQRYERIAPGGGALRPVGCVKTVLETNEELAYFSDDDCTTLRNLRDPQKWRLLPEPAEPQAAAPPVKPEAPKAVCIDCDTAPMGREVPLRFVDRGLQARRVCDDCYLRYERYVDTGPVAPCDVPAKPTPWKPGDSAIAAARGEKPQTWRKR